MAIELICKGCSRKLRIADENAGKLARCPSCGETFTVPAAAGPAFGGMTTTMAPAPLPSAASDRWYLKTEDGNTYGPVPKAELDSWAAEGRMTAESQLLREGETTWQPARQLYPMLRSSAPKPAYAPPSPASPAGNPFAETGPAPYQNPYASPQGPTQTRSGMIGGVYVQPHRGGVILTLGILSFCFCPFVLSIAAVVMASQDLKLMNEGRMDASGKGLTIAGMVMGIISILMSGLVFLARIGGGFN